MDPLTGTAIVGVGYFAWTRGNTPATQPENGGSVIPTTKAPLPRSNGGIGGFLADGVANAFLDVTRAYNAPTTKAIAVPVLIGITVVGVAAVFATVAFGSVAAGGYVGVIVVVILAIVFAVFVAAANHEDVDRYNKFITQKQMVVKAVAGGNFRLAMNIAVEGARQQIPGLGFYLKETPTVYGANTLYYKTAFDATPAIKDPLHEGGVFGRGGLDRDYIYPAVKRYEYETYFGNDGAHIAVGMNGATYNMITILRSFKEAQAQVYGECVRILGRPPTQQEWVTTCDSSKDATGNTLRSVIDAHDVFGKAVQPSVPWLDTWLLQSIDFPLSVQTQTGYVTRQSANVSGGHTQSKREEIENISGISSFTV